MPPHESRNALPAGMHLHRALAAGGAPRGGAIPGHVEHFASGRNEDFGSLPELLAFLGRVLKSLSEMVEQAEA